MTSEDTSEQIYTEPTNRKEPTEEEIDEELRTLAEIIVEAYFEMKTTSNLKSTSSSVLE